MSALMKISEFAALCGTTVHTVLHYERMGLIAPVQIGSNGYRYYDSSQAYRFVSIKALADAGFSLTETSDLLDSRDFDKLDNALRTGKQNVKERIRSMRDALARLEELDRQAKDASSLVYDEIVVSELPDMWCIDVGIGKRGTSPQYAEDPSAVAADRATLSRLIADSPAAGLAPYGLISHGPLQEGPVVYDGMFYLIRDEKIVHRLGFSYMIPAGSYACLATVAPCDKLRYAHQQVMDYVEAQGGDPHARRFEVSTYRFFDVMSIPGQDMYSCIVAMRLS